MSRHGVLGVTLEDSDELAEIVIEDIQEEMGNKEIYDEYLE